MPKVIKSAPYIARHIRKLLKDHGSPQHAAGVQGFFKEEVRSHGWYTADLRKVASRFRKVIEAHQRPGLLLDVADKLFRGRVLEEKIVAVFLLEKQTAKFGHAEFLRFDRWLDRVASWADHDALVHYLIGPMIAADPRRAKSVFRWAKSSNRWRRRAAAVALIQATRRKMLFQDIVRLSSRMLADQDDMVQKGLGWLLRETAKANARPAVPYLMKIRSQAPRLVLRTACETLPAATRRRILA